MIKTYSINAWLEWHRSFDSFQISPSLWYNLWFSDANSFSRAVRVLFERAKVGHNSEQPNEQQQHRQPRSKSLAFVEWCWRSKLFTRDSDASNSSRDTRPMSVVGKSLLKVFDKPNKVIFPLPRIIIGSMLGYSITSASKSARDGPLEPLLVSISSIISSKWSWRLEWVALGTWMGGPGGGMEIESIDEEEDKLGGIARVWAISDAMDFNDNVLTVLSWVLIEKFAHRSDRPSI